MPWTDEEPQTNAKNAYVRATLLPGQINIVFGARDHKLYFYNSVGDIGKPMKLKDFLP